MNKTTTLVGSIIAAIILVLQQALGQPTVDWKVIGISVLITVGGIVGTFLKGRGATFWGAIGVTIFTFINVYQSGSFTWNEFILTALIAIGSLFAPTLIPQLADKE